MLPATSTAVAVMVWSPFAKGMVGVKRHTPAELVSAVPATLPSICTLIVLPAFATPVKVGSATLVMPSPATPLSLAGARRMGGVGEMVSICSDKWAAVDMLPATSTAVAVMVWSPFAKGMAGVKRHTPAALASAVPATLPSICTLIVLPAFATPVKVGSVTLVMPSPATPLSLVGARRMVGVGDDVSISTTMLATLAVALAASVTPLCTVAALPTSGAPSTAVAVMVCLPLAIAVAGVKFHRPVALASAVPASLPSMCTVTVLPAIARPVKLGRVTSVMSSPAMPLSLPSVRPMVGFVIKLVIG